MGVIMGVAIGVLLCTVNFAIQLKSGGHGI